MKLEENKKSGFRHTLAAAALALGMAVTSNSGDAAAQSMQRIELRCEQTGELERRCTDGSSQYPIEIAALRERYSPEEKRRINKSYDNIIGALGLIRLSAPAYFQTIIGLGKIRITYERGLKDIANHSCFNPTTISINFGDALGYYPIPQIASTLAHELAGHGRQNRLGLCGDEFRTYRECEATLIGLDVYNQVGYADTYTNRQVEFQNLNNWVGTYCQGFWKYLRNKGHNPERMPAAEQLSHIHGENGFLMDKYGPRYEQILLAQKKDRMTPEEFSKRTDEILRKMYPHLYNKK